MAKQATTQIDMFTAVEQAFKRYSDFEGRSNRAEFWWYVLFLVLAGAFFNIFNFMELGNGASVGSVLSSVFWLVTIIPSLAISVRRLRDMGEGWGNIFWILVPIAGIIILVVYWTRPTVTGKASARKA